MSCHTGGSKPAARLMRVVWASPLPRAYTHRHHATMHTCFLIQTCTIIEGEVGENKSTLKPKAMTTVQYVEMHVAQIYQQITSTNRISDVAS